MTYLLDYIIQENINNTYTNDVTFGLWPCSWAEDKEKYYFQVSFNS